MKRTKLLTSLLLALLLCGSVLLTACNVAEDGKKQTKECQSTTVKPEFEDPKATDEISEFMIEQAKAQFGGVPWGSTPAEITEYMKTQDCLIEEGTSFIHGREQIEAFYENSENGKPGFVKIIFHYVPAPNAPEREKDSAHLQLIYFDGSLYHSVHLDANGETDGNVETYPYLIHESGHEELDWVSRDYNRYFLTNDETMTYQRYMNAVLSSVAAPPSGKISTFGFVCSEYTNRVIKEVE